MPNEHVNHVVINGVIKVDLRADTVTADKLAQGYTAHDASGAAITGSYTPPTPTLQAKTRTIDSAGTFVDTPDSGYDGLSSVTTTVPEGEMHAEAHYGYFTESGARKWRIRGVAEISIGDSYGTPGFVADGTVVYGDWITRNAIATGTTVTPTTSAQTIGGTGYMMEGAVTVNPIPSQYIVPTGNKEITSNGTGIDVAQYSTVSVNVSGGGGSTTQTDWIDEQSSMTSSTITFTGLKGEPTSFAINIDADLATGSPAKVAAIVFDGTTLHGQTVTNTSNAQASYDTGFTKSYSNGTLTVTATNAQFQSSVVYCLAYTYGGSSANVGTSDVQVGSGATSITFTGLEDEPIWWNCIFKSNFGTSSGYQRVMFASENSFDSNVFGMCLDSSAHIGQYWTATYNNGSFTISSQGTNAGGYFHQPGYYQLTYVVGEASLYQAKTVTPTTSQQVVTPDAGYEALSQVTVNKIPSTYVQPTSTVGATTYRPSTTSQTIASGTYHSGAGTIAAVTQTNLSAENIKSGTTISISNGQSDLWSVTGSYTGGGGSVTVNTTTMTNNSATATQIQFTSLTGQPKAFFCRCTSNLSRNSSNRYYYIADIRWDGSSTGGVTGNKYYVYNGQYSNQTTGYSQSYSNGTLTLTTTGSQTASPGSFYNGTYELVYVY